MAVDHVNERNGSVVPQVSHLTCPISFDITLLDSLFEFTPTLSQYFFYKDVLMKAPSGIVGPGRTTTTIPLSFVSSIDNVPIVGYAATARGSCK